LFKKDFKRTFQLKTWSIGQKSIN